MSSGIRCPHCKKRHDYEIEWSYEDYEIQEIECDCGKTYKVQLVISHDVYVLDDEGDWV